MCDPARSTREEAQQGLPVRTSEGWDQGVNTAQVRVTAGRGGSPYTGQLRVFHSLRRSFHHLPTETSNCCPKLPTWPIPLVGGPALDLWDPRLTQAPSHYLLPGLAQTLGASEETLLDSS